MTDDGAGYDTRRTPMGSGLRNMADRLAALGGQLQLRSAPGQGTTLTATLPLPSQANPDEALRVSDVALPRQRSLRHQLNRSNYAGSQTPQEFLRIGLAVGDQLVSAASKAMICSP